MLAVDSDMMSAERVFTIGRSIGMRTIPVAALIGLLVACGSGSGAEIAPSSQGSTTTASTIGTTTTKSTAPTTVPSTTTITLPLRTDESTEQSWSAVEAERYVTNYLAALAAGAYEQAAWAAHNNGVTVDGQLGNETPVQALTRQCDRGACAGHYAVHAVGPGLRDAETSQASSIVAVTHVESGVEGVIRLFTFEGQLVIGNLPPLVPSVGVPTLVESLFGDGLPRRVVVQRFDAFEIWEDGTSDWVTNWWAGDTYQVEGEVAASRQRVVSLREARTIFEGGYGRLMVRDNEVLVLEGFDTDGWRMFEVISGDIRSTPVPFRQLLDGEYVWFSERGGTVVHGLGNAEGNPTSLETEDRLDLLGDGSASLVILSADGRHVAYLDHADPAAISHFYTPVIVVKDVSTGDEVGRWTLGNAVVCLEFGESWVVACEADPETLDQGAPEQIALVAINIETGHVNRIATPTRIFLPSISPKE